MIPPTLTRRLEPTVAGPTDRAVSVAFVCADPDARIDRDDAASVEADTLARRLDEAPSVPVARAVRLAFVDARFVACTVSVLGLEESPVTRATSEVDAGTLAVAETRSVAGDVFDDVARVVRLDGAEIVPVPIDTTVRLAAASLFPVARTVSDEGAVATLVARIVSDDGAIVSTMARIASDDGAGATPVARTVSDDDPIVDPTTLARRVDPTDDTPDARTVRLALREIVP